MYRVAALSNQDRKEIFNTCAIMTGKSPVVIEKDFWVTVLIDYLFNKSKYKHCFTFKGGTSLSTCFGID